MNPLNAGIAIAILYWESWESKIEGTTNPVNS